MITKLTLENYESHKNTIIDFPVGPGLTVFVGESDRGKSGIFRGFDFLSNNVGSKEMFPLYWKGTSKVTAETSFKDTFIRTKSKSENIYQINNKEPINAGTGVPSDVSDLLNMSDINFQNQIDRAYLMFDTPGERGRILNKITGLDKIDSSIKASKSDVLRINRDMETKKKLIKETEEKLIKFESLPNAEDLIQQSSILHQKISTTASAIGLITRLLDSKIEKELKAERFYGLDAALIGQTKAETLLLSYLETEKNINIIKKAIGRKAVIQKALIRPEQLLHLDGIIHETEELLLQMDTVVSSIKKCENLQDQKKTKQSLFNLTNNKIEQLKKLIPNICIECGSEIENENEKK